MLWLQTRCNDFRDSTRKILSKTKNVLLSSNFQSFVVYLSIFCWWFPVFSGFYFHSDALKIQNEVIGLICLGFLANVSLILFVKDKHESAAWIGLIIDVMIIVLAVMLIIYDCLVLASVEQTFLLDDPANNMTCAISGKLAVNKTHISFTAKIRDCQPQNRTTTETNKEIPEESTVIFSISLFFKVLVILTNVILGYLFVSNTKNRIITD